MAASYITSGVISDATASQDTGALCTGIGVGPAFNHSGPNAEQGLTAAAFTAARLGDATAGVVYALGTGYGTSKGVRYVQASGAVADGAVVTAGWVNRSGRALVSGDYVWAVAA
ncbi:hypothetical protein UFOVP840_39 [uncultured Caudovirales phage]|uniref:Uncharacterized protein n=1 Tax=uncultured Caudovirales phage TaxID=2100421 RepID=A0A6J5P5V1_9CAUD|nr:hypothetical protein UFOVP840_39 [uncultured Caudovirales phage]